MRPGIDHIGVGVGALIFNQEKKFLLTQRGPAAKNERGKWEAPGGTVEFGETFEQAIIREVWEELGITIRVIAFLTLCDHILPKEQQHWIAPTYICELVSGTPQIQEPEKCSVIGWFVLEEAEELELSEVTKHGVQALREQGETLNLF